MQAFLQKLAKSRKNWLGTGTFYTRVVLIESRVIEEEPFPSRAWVNHYLLGAGGIFNHGAHQDFVTVVLKFIVVGDKAATFFVSVQNIYVLWTNADRSLVRNLDDNTLNQATRFVKCGFKGSLVSPSTCTFPKPSSMPLNLLTKMSGRYVLFDWWLHQTNTFQTHHLACDAFGVQYDHEKP